MAYTKRTCSQCGYRDIQPNMVEKEVEYVSGTSNTGITKRTVVGSILGSKKSSNQLAKWLVAPNKRVYKRKRKVWMCGQCAEASNSDMSTLDTILAVIKGIMGFAVIVGVLLFLMYA